MRILFLLSMIIVPLDLIAATSTLSCFGYYGPKASPATVFARDIDITNDLMNSEVPFKKYSMINDFGFELEVLVNSSQKTLAVMLTKREFTHMSFGKLEGAKLILANAKTKENLVTVDCGVVTEN